MIKIVNVGITKNTLGWRFFGDNTKPFNALWATLESCKDGYVTAKDMYVSVTSEVKKVYDNTLDLMDKNLCIVSNRRGRPLIHRCDEGQDQTFVVLHVKTPLGQFITNVKMGEGIETFFYRITSDRTGFVAIVKINKPNEFIKLYCKKDGVSTVMLINDVSQYERECSFENKFSKINIEVTRSIKRYKVLVIPVGDVSQVDDITTYDECITVNDTRLKDLITMGVDVNIYFDSRISDEELIIALADIKDCNKAYIVSQTGTVKRLK